MRDKDIEDLRAVIATLEGQSATLGNKVLALDAAPLRARLASLQRPAGLQHRQAITLRSQPHDNDVPIGRLPIHLVCGA